MYASSSELVSKDQVSHFQHMRVAVFRFRSVKYTQPYYTVQAS